MTSKTLVFDSYAQVMELKMYTLYSVHTAVGKVCMIRRPLDLLFFKDACPHLGVPLSQGGVCNSFGELVCREHGHRYSLDSGWECEGKKERLQFIPHKVEDGKVYLMLS